DVDSRKRAGHRNHPNRGANGDGNLGTRIHENSLRFEFFIVTSKAATRCCRSRLQLSPAVAKTPHGVGAKPIFSVCKRRTNCATEGDSQRRATLGFTLVADAHPGIPAL